MPPLRRYLRITSHSVLEVRIYLDNPTDTHRWLLHPRNPVLPRVIEAVRPLVLPKLREENARAKSGKGKRKGWKDVVVQDEFEVAVFLTETSTRHSILRKEKMAKRLGTVEGRLTGSRDMPVEVGDGAPGILREESDESQGVRLADLPAAVPGDGEGMSQEVGEDNEDELFVSDGASGDEDVHASGKRSVSKVKKLDAEGAEGEDARDDKKKLALDTEYDGFSIYGRILCLVVKRRGTAKGKEVAGGAGQAMMEDWITSTQMAEGQMMDE